jgi:hypothetical protein
VRGAAAAAAAPAAAAAEVWSPSVSRAGGTCLRIGPPSAVPCVAALNIPALAGRRNGGATEAFEKKAPEEGEGERLRSHASSAPVQLREPDERWKSRAMNMDEFWESGEGGDAPDEWRPKKRRQQQQQPTGTTVSEPGTGLPTLVEGDPRHVVPSGGASEATAAGLGLVTTGGYHEIGPRKVRVQRRPTHLCSVDQFSNSPSPASPSWFSFDLSFPVVSLEAGEQQRSLSIGCGLTVPARRWKSQKHRQRCTSRNSRQALASKVLLAQRHACRRRLRGCWDSGQTAHLSLRLLPRAHANEGVKRMMLPVSGSSTHQLGRQSIDQGKGGPP